MSAGGDVTDREGPVTDEERTTIDGAAREYVSALTASREQYVQTARNAPREEDVRARKRARLERAEDRLRAVLGFHDARCPRVHVRDEPRREHDECACA